jgi:hypothetical protein
MKEFSAVANQFNTVPTWTPLFKTKRYTQHFMFSPHCWIPQTHEHKCHILQYHSILQNSPLLIIHFLPSLTMLCCHIRSIHSHLPVPVLLGLLLLRALGILDLFWHQYLFHWSTSSITARWTIIFRCWIIDKKKFVWLLQLAFCYQTSGWWDLWVQKWRDQDHC